MARTSLTIPIQDVSRVGEARRAGQSVASRQPLSEASAGRLAIVVTELATNLHKHARGGEIVLRPLHGGPASGVEVLALDRGPGMKDVSQCLRDGYSTAGSPGNGLGAVQRLSDRFDIHSLPGTGTAVVAQVWNEPPPPTAFDVGAVCVAIAGEVESGDDWAVFQDASHGRVVVADGLGHGHFAAEAAQEATRVFESDALRAPADFITAAHAALRKTRGAAVAEAAIFVSTGDVRFSGVGNIGAQLLEPGKAGKSLMSHNGTVGAEMRKVQELTYPWGNDKLLVMHSDGLASRWHVDPYPGLALRHPSLIAGVLYRDFRRPHDDVTVVVLKHRDARSKLSG